MLSYAARQLIKRARSEQVRKEAPPPPSRWRQSVGTGVVVVANAGRKRPEYATEGWSGSDYS